MSDDILGSAFYRRVSRSPLERNKDDLLAGRRWDLLQAIAWIASEDQSLVDEVGSWCPPENSLPHENAAQGAAIELEDRLRSGEGLTFQQALIELLDLLSGGSVFIYVEHVEFRPIGIQFQSLRYDDDMIGLNPSPDDRYWGYIVLEAAGLKAAWSKAKQAAHAVAGPASGQSPQSGSAAIPPPQLPKTPGRPPKYDWVGADTALMEQDGSEDTFARVLNGELSQAYLEQYMAGWFSQRGPEPGESTIRQRVSKLLAHRREVNAAKASK